jgi:predicted alpha/beta-hydrolase family hydrolase
MSERFRFDVDGERLTAIAYPAVKPLGSTLLLGHGASAGQHDRFILDYAAGLAERGVLVVTYDFPFMAHKRSSPDRFEVLEACCRAAIVAARQCRPKNKLFIGGKSLGGRVASEVAAAGGEEADEIAGLVVLGYPLHPIGKPTASRARHLGDLRVPALFVQGTRDAFGTSDELRGVLGALPKGSEIYAVDGGDHSFTVGKQSPLTQDEVHAGIQEEIARWISVVTSAPKATARASSRPRPVASRVRAQLRTLRRSVGP